MWRLINGFGSLHNKEQLLHMIDEYADGGGNGGVTLRCVQKSCGVDVEAANTALVDANALPNLLFDPVGNVDVEDRKIATSLAVSVLTHGTGSITMDQVQKTLGAGVISGNPATREQVFRRLLSKSPWKASNTSYRAPTTYIPTINTNYGIIALAPQGRQPATPELIEEIRSREFIEYADNQIE